MSAPEPDATGDQAGADERHDPTWLHARQYGRWCACSCGWTSQSGTVAFAQDAFGRHLLDVSPIVPVST